MKLLSLLALLTFVSLVSVNVIAYLPDEDPACATAMMGDHCPVCLKDDTVQILRNVGYDCSNVIDVKGNTVETQMICTRNADGDTDDDSAVIALDAAACSTEDADANNDS
ncbi:MAG: hypothetical protein OXB84_06900 [Halobacteriovoraceae bacterium]|nr:hypothetical protein [Halobacteriovoraceae bacterium]